MKFFRCVYIDTLLRYVLNIKFLGMCRHVVIVVEK